MRQSFYILVDRDNLLEILVLSVTEDGVVNNDAVHGSVVVRFDEAVLKELAVDFAQVKCEATTMRLVSGFHPTFSQRLSHGRGEYRLMDALTFQHKSCLSILRIPSRQDLRWRGSQRVAACAESCSDHRALRPEDPWRCCSQG